MEREHVKAIAELNKKMQEEKREAQKELEKEEQNHRKTLK